MHFSEPHPPLWLSPSDATRYPPLSGPLDTDVVVVGGGITGLTTAYLLQRQGVQVVLMELHRLAEGETGHTTAHLTELVDRRYHLLEHAHGRRGARQVAESSRAAIELMARLCEELHLHCTFMRVPAFLYTERDAHLHLLEKEMEALQRVGLSATLTRQVPLPFPVKLAIRVEHQAQLHPRAYLLPLAERFSSDGGRIFEQTRVLNVEDGRPCRVTTQHGTVNAAAVVVAANVPIHNKFLLLTRIAAYRTSVVAGPSAWPVPPGLYWDTETPYHYTRTQRTSSGNMLIVGGEDHKVGKPPDKDGAYPCLEAYARDRFGLSATFRWSGQVVESVDGLPFIGLNPGSRHVYVATGYSGTGMTWGTVAGMLLSDEIQGLHNPWASLYGASRIKPLAQAKSYLAENLDFPTHLIRDRFQRGEVTSLSEVKRGEGRLMQVRGKMLAVYRDEAGEVSVVSAVCRHLGCHVGWNSAERTWDCPCHGARYDAVGRVLNGPAVEDLEPPRTETRPGDTQSAPSEGGTQEDAP